MIFYPSIVWVTAFLSLLFSSLVRGQSDSTPNSVFVLPLGKHGGNNYYTYALNVPSGSNDIYFRLSGPASYSWMAVGTGTEMKDSLMFIAYVNSTGNGVTLSPRLCTDTTEPIFSPSLHVELLAGSGIYNGTMVVNGRCSNCQQWSTGSLDLNSTAQPWIYALGPTSAYQVLLGSDSKTASIERHSEYGRFTMDMVSATGGTGGLPTFFSTTSVGSALDGNPTSDSNWPAIIHALALCGAFILFMPTGVIFLRIFPGSVRWHWVNQTLATIIALIGLVVGLYLSTMYTRSKSFNSTHQIIGLLCIFALLAQWAFGFWHHRVYKRTQVATKFGKVHRYFGGIVILLAIVNGGIGLTWSAASSGIIIGYAIAVVVIVLPIVVVVLWKRWISRRNENKVEGSSTDRIRLVSNSSVPLDNYHDPQYQRL